MQQVLLTAYELFFVDFLQILCVWRQYRTEHEGYTTSPGIEIKISDPVGSRTRAAGLEDRDSTDNATATDYRENPDVKLL